MYPNHDHFDRPAVLLQWAADERRIREIRRRRRAERRQTLRRWARRRTRRSRRTRPATTMASQEASWPQVRHG